jgi:DNA-binding NtrC family response regulator
LIVEDEPLIAIDLGQSFEDAGAAVTIVGCLSDAISAVNSGGISAAVVDRSLPDGDSSALHGLLARCGVPYIVVTGHSELKCEDEGAAACFDKPADPSRVMQAVEDIFGEKSQTYFANGKA